MKNILEEIEDKYDVKELKTVKGLFIWPFLRQKIYFNELLKKTGYNNSKKRTRKKVQLFRNYFYGFTKLFYLKKIEYLCFQNTNKRVQINFKYFDPYFDAWADKLGQDKTLFVEFANIAFHKSKDVYSKNVLSDLPFKSACFISSLFVNLSTEETKQLLTKIYTDFDIEINTKKELKKALGELNFYKFLFNFIKPNAIFVLSSFTKMSIVAAARQLGIKVFEAQHGYIGDGHPFYFSKHNFPNTFPNYLISFGTYELNENFKNFIFNPKDIIPVGGLELEIKKNLPIPEELVEIRKKFNKVFCITMQAIKERELIEMISNYAFNNKDCIFIICPKNLSADYSKLLTDNIILSQFSIYNILSISDFNITIFSTTVVEASMFGVKNIFYNIDNLSRKYFNLERIGGILIEENEKLTESHIEKLKNSDFQYYLDNYFNNVDERFLNI